MSFTETKGYLKTKNSQSAFYGFSLGCRHLGTHTPRTTTKLQLQAEGSLLLLPALHENNNNFHQCF